MHKKAFVVHVVLTNSSQQLLYYKTLDIILIRTIYIHQPIIFLLLLLITDQNENAM